MASIDLSAAGRQARAGYERARLTRAILGFSPVLIVVGAAAGVSRHPVSALLFGATLFVAGVSLLWRGNGLHRGVLPGVGFGLIPLALSLAANFFHGCDGEHCSSLCVPACATGGVIAGVLVSFVAARRGLGWPFLAAASAVSVLTGAMGCACAGYSGVLALTAGFAAAMLPMAARRLAR